MNRQELEKLFTESLKIKLLNTKYCNKNISDVRVQIQDGYCDYYDNDGYGDTDHYNEIKIEVKTTKGKNSTWETYYI